MAAPVERKVQASATVAAASGMVLWLLGKYVFKGAVPDVLVSWVYVAVPGALAFAAGYLARHSPRPGPQQDQVHVVLSGPGGTNTAGNTATATGGIT